MHSPTIDEVEWLPGGWAQWKTGRWDLVVRNPPHVGLVAAIPLLFANPDATSLDSADNARSIGREFIRTNGRRSFWLFTLARWACIPFSLIGAITCFAWARDLYGSKSGLLAVTLWCFCPNLLAHGQLVAHDVAATSLGLMACYAFWRWLRHTSITTTVAAGVSLGVALLTKMTILLYVALWPVMWIAWRLATPERRWSARAWLCGGASLAAILILALDLLNAGYGFYGTLSRLDSYSFRSHALVGRDGRGNRFANSIVGEIPVPLPASYVVGLDVQRFGQEGGFGEMGHYLRGKWSNRSAPHYYLYALSIKVPLGTWCLLLMAVVFRLCRLDSKQLARDEVILMAPAVALLLVASSSAGFTNHVRYVLPCVPFVFIWISRLAQVTWSEHRWFALWQSPQPHGPCSAACGYIRTVCRTSTRLQADRATAITIW